MHEYSYREATDDKALDLVRRLMPLNPGMRFAIAPRGTMIGVWSDEAARFVAVIAWAITGQWVSMDYEVLVNGRLPVEAGEWKEVL